MTTPTKTLIRASVQGIVYLIDSAQGHVYSYNPEKPVYLGDLERIPEEDKQSISKTNGCMATARVRYRADIREVMTAERRLHDENLMTPTLANIIPNNNNQNGGVSAPTPTATT